MSTQKCLPCAVGIHNLFPTLRNSKLSGFWAVKCDKPGSKDVKRRNIRKGDIRNLTDSRCPLLPRSYVTFRGRNPTPGNLGGWPELFPEFRNSGFRGRRCDATVFKSVSRRNLRPCATRHLRDSVGPCPQCPILHVDA